MNDKNKIPKHVAIIMDGNGRWASQRGLPRTAGHRAGIARIRELLKSAGELGIQVVTLFAFSTENWARPKKEINMLMRSLSSFLDKEVERFHKNNIKLKVIGRDEPIPKYILEKLKKARNRTKDNTGLTVVLALNYGARQEIVDAAKKLARALLEGETAIDDVEIEDFSQYLYTAGIPEPDLLIRTSGEMRISNFLLWQLSYTELYFIDKYWPDFRRRDLEEALSEFAKRERRFGGIDGGQKID